MDVKIWMLALMGLGFLAGCAFASAMLGTGMLVDRDDDEVNLSAARRKELKHTVGVLWVMVAITLGACIAAVMRG